MIYQGVRLMLHLQEIRSLLFLLSADKIGSLSAIGEAKLRWQKDQTQYKQAKQQER